MCPCGNTGKLYPEQHYEECCQEAERVITAFCSALVQSHLEYSVKFRGPQYKKDMKLLERAQ